MGGKVESGVEDMEFPGISKKGYLEFPRHITQFREIFRAGALVCMEFSGVK